MGKGLTKGAGRAAALVREGLGRLDVLALFPLLTLSALMLDLGDAVVISAFLLPALLAFQAWAPPARQHAPTAPPVVAEKTGRAAVFAKLAEVAAMPDHDTACIVLQIDDWSGLVDRRGSDTAEDIAIRLGERVSSAMRRDDCVERIGDGRFAVVLYPLRAVPLGTRDAIIARLRSAIAAPLALRGGALALTVSAGHVTLQRDGVDPVADTFAAAELALSEAHNSGPGSSCAFTPNLLTLRDARLTLAQQVETALDGNEIRPWFEPQLDLHTGALYAVEASARWHHPDRGLLEADGFLDAVEAAGQMDAFGQRMLDHALAALQSWDAAGIKVPFVSVAISTQALRNVKLAERIAWQLDRAGLAAERLILAAPATAPGEGEDPAAVATLEQLGALGVRLDLEDFGFGQTSLLLIRHLGIRRASFDASFLLGLNDEAGDRSVVRAILSMAPHLGIEVLAKGVASERTRTALTEMGCPYAQGAAIADAMPLERATAWLKARQGAPVAKTMASPGLGRRAG